MTALPADLQGQGYVLRVTDCNSSLNASLRWLGGVEDAMADKSLVERRQRQRERKQRQLENGQTCRPENNGTTRKMTKTRNRRRQRVNQRIAQAQNALGDCATSGATPTFATPTPQGAAPHFVTLHMSALL